MNSCRNNEFGESPGRGRYAGEGCVRLVLLDEVAEGGEDEDAHGQEEKEEAKLFVTVFQRVSNGLKWKVK